MAIKTDFITERGIMYPDQYMRVDQVHCTKTDMNIVVGIYVTQEQAANGAPPHFAEVLFGEFDMNSPLNLWEQAYAAVKQRWPNAVDLL